MKTGRAATRHKRQRQDHYKGIAVRDAMAMGRAIA